MCSQSTARRVVGVYTVTVLLWTNALVVCCGGCVFWAVEGPLSSDRSKKLFLFNLLSIEARKFREPVQHDMGKCWDSSFGLF